VVGFDGRLVSASFVKKIQAAWAKQRRGGDTETEIELKIVSDADIAGAVWEQDKENKRPSLSAEPVWILPDEYAGKDTAEKLAEVRSKMKEEGADILLLTALDDIAWLVNLRGGDIAYNPVFLSYMIVTRKKAILYLRTCTQEIKDYLNERGIVCRKYERFYEDVSKIRAGRTVWADEASAGYQVMQSIPAGCGRIEKRNPVFLEKAVKNSVEVSNERLAHKKDAVALVKLLYWLKTKVCTGEEPATELSVAARLESLRQQQEHYLGQSFAPIAAYAEHGAIVHYEPQEETDSVIGAESFLLLDTGGHYLEGTTDITRTVAMGALSEEEKKHYTAVLQGNLRLADVRFPHGLTGSNLDYIAREPLYRLGLDFNHGTGHGVGYLLNVHEGPNAFRRKAGNEAVFEEGMITSDEPGLYLEGKYGIRLENMILCKKAEETEYGTFLQFEPLTLVPFDRAAIDAEMLTERDKALLNGYHKEVYRQISPYLTEKERAWLAQETQPV
jgi:Xaa-Pro aminopeptidase